MPVTIKTATMKYKDANGDYIGVDAVAETTTSEQVAAVEAAGAEQVAAIEEIGDEIKQDIYQTPWELIKEDEFTNAESASYTISTDSNGQTFALSSLRLVLYFPVQAVESKYDYWTVKINDGQTSGFDTCIDKKTQSAGATSSVSMIEILTANGMRTVATIPFGGNNTFGSVRWRLRNDRSATDFPWRLDTSDITTITFPAVIGTMHYILYGRRSNG